MEAPSRLAFDKHKIAPRKFKVISRFSSVAQTRVTQSTAQRKKIENNKKRKNAVEQTF